MTFQVFSLIVIMWLLVWASVNASIVFTRGNETDGESTAAIFILLGVAALALGWLVDTFVS